MIRAGCEKRDGNLLRIILPTRFVVACWFDASEDEMAAERVWQTRQRTCGQRGVPWASDGRKVYCREVARTDRGPQQERKRGRPRLVSTPGVGLTRVVQRRRKGRVVKVTIRHVTGVAVEFPAIVPIERLNGVWGDRLNCLTRKTHAFAKSSQTWDAAGTVYRFEHNGIRSHPALRELLLESSHGKRYWQRTPAMAMSLSDHQWSWENF